MKKIDFGTLAVAHYEKKQYHAILLNYIAETVEYKDDAIYDSRKGGLAEILKKGLIKHAKTYDRAMKKLIKLGLVTKIKNRKGGPYCMYMLTEKAVEIAKVYKFN